MPVAPVIPKNLSSGYWGGSGSIFTSPTTGPAPYFPGMPTGGVPNRYTAGTGTGAAPGSSNGFTPQVVEKFPGSGYNDAISGLLKSLNSNALPHYSDTLSSFTAANGALPGAFDRYQGALDIGGYAQGQRGFNPQFSNLTDRYAGTARGIGDQYGQSVQDYARTGQGIVDANMANAVNFRDVQIPNSINDALSTVNKNLKLYDFANPGGYNSAIPAIGGREAVRATLPFRLQANQAVGEATRFGLPFAGDVASRYANLAGFNLGNERDIYGQQQGDLARAQQTEDKIQNLKVQTAGLSLEAAIRKAPTIAAGAYELSRIYNLPVEDIMKRAQAMGVVLGLQNQANYTGVQGPAQYLSSPQGYSNSAGPLSRYAPATSTATPGAQVQPRRALVPSVLSSNRYGIDSTDLNGQPVSVNPALYTPDYYGNDGSTRSDIYGQSVSVNPDTYTPSYF